MLDGEPMREDNPLRQIQDSGKLIITPHIAWAPKETRERLLDGVYENIKKPVIPNMFDITGCT